MRWTCFFLGLLLLNQESKRRQLACCGFATSILLPRLAFQAMVSLVRNTSFRSGFASLSRFVSFLTLGLMTGCQSSSPWIASHVQAGNATYNSSRLSYRLHDIVNEIGVEMVCAQGLINTYLEVHTQQIPPYQGNLKEALIVMNTSDQTKQAIGYRHEGGQRISLSADLQEFLITSLQNNQTVTISLEGYATTLNPHNFTTQFEKLHAKPFANPFQLPFKL